MYKHITMRKTCAVKWQQQSLPSPSHRNHSCILISLTFVIIIIIQMVHDTEQQTAKHNTEFTHFSAHYIKLLLLFRFTDDRRQSFEKNEEMEMPFRIGELARAVLMTSLWIDTKLGDNYIVAEQLQRRTSNRRSSEFIAPLQLCATGNVFCRVLISMPIDTMRRGIVRLVCVCWKMCRLLTFFPDENRQPIQRTDDWRALLMSTISS